MTENPDLPAWVNHLRVRQVLWEKYGITSDDMTMVDVVQALRLDVADQRRHVNLVRRG